MQQLPNFRVDGQLALVTGSAQGLGNAIAWALAASGAHVILNGRNLDLLLEQQRQFTQPD